MSNLSNCCSEPVVVINGKEGTSYHQCSKCEKACDILTPGQSDINHLMMYVAQHSDVFKPTVVGNQFIQIDYLPNWTPVTKDLPKTAEAVIVSTDSGEVAIGKCFYAKYAGNRYWSIVGFDDFLDVEHTVIAWMPRPGVYKPIGEEK